MTYRVTDFSYEFPDELIAQRPLPNRGDSRLLHADRDTAFVSHRTFAELPDVMVPGDVLVVNTSRVIPARLRGIRENGRPAEVLLVSGQEDGSWLAMVHPGGKLKVGRTVRFGDAVATIVAVVGGGLRRIELAPPSTWESVMREHGTVPLPPYIERDADPADRSRYQTVYATAEGSVAAPTAGLHFTDEMLQTVQERGCGVADVVLHVGPGTFKPVQVEDVRDHTMHAEWFSVPAETAQRVNDAKAAGHRVFAVGTTVTRVLETAGATGRVAAGTGWTDLFVYPPYDFRIVDALVTNFHLPQSTLLMLVHAFGGRELMQRAYTEAIDRCYRLFSYGDAMVIT